MVRGDLPGRDATGAMLFVAHYDTVSLVCTPLPVGIVVVWIGLAVVSEIWAPGFAYLFGIPALAATLLLAVATLTIAQLHQASRQRPRSSAAVS